ncbi:arginase family protein [Nonomuraea sp. NPDC001684]
MTSDTPAATPWALNPAFRIEGAELVNDTEGVRLALTEPLRELWNGRATLPAVRLTPQAEQALRRVRLIVPMGAAAAAGGGLARVAVTPLALPAGKRANAAAWGVIGAPVDLGGPPGPRPRDGVPVIRAALARRLRLLGQDGAWSWSLRARPADGLPGVADHGDLLVDPATDTGVTAHERLRALVGAVVAQGHRPLVVGGDHSVSYPAIGAVADAHPGLRVVHVDAHADRRPRGERATADCGNFVSWALAEHSRLRWLTVGVRGVDPQVDLAADAHEERVAYLTADEAAEPGTAERIARFCDGRPVYLTVDVDALDPVHAPDVVYPCSGGFAPATLTAVARAVAGAGRLVGADLVEACPSPTGRHLAARHLADLMVTVLLEEARRALSAPHDQPEPLTDDLPGAVG